MAQQGSGPPRYPPDPAPGVRGPGPSDASPQADEELPPWAITAPVRPPAPTTKWTPPGQPMSKPTPTDPGWVQVSDGRGGTAFQRNFHLTGGDLTVLADQREARIISSRARPGCAAAAPLGGLKCRPFQPASRECRATLIP